MSNSSNLHVLDAFCKNSKKKHAAHFESVLFPLAQTIF